MKKIGLFLLSVFGIFGFGASFANPIITEPLKTCYKLNNVEIDNYNVIITENYVPKNKTKDEEKIIDDTVDGSIMSGDAEEDIIVLKNYASKNKTKDEEIAFDGSVGGFHIIPEDEEEDIIVPKIFVPKANDCIRLDHEEDLSFRDLYLGKVVNVFKFITSF